MMTRCALNSVTATLNTYMHTLSQIGLYTVAMSHMCRLSRGLPTPARVEPPTPPPPAPPEQQEAVVAVSLAPKAEL